MRSTLNTHEETQYNNDQSLEETQKITTNDIEKFRMLSKCSELFF